MLKLISSCTKRTVSRARRGIGAFSSEGAPFLCPFGGLYFRRN
uniref:Uncharacterized protein n=1 Tax=Dulem virus 31 TaxID=3145749 RepID=A0AAU8AUP8_9VIRU